MNRRGLKGGVFLWICFLGSGALAFWFGRYGGSWIFVLGLLVFIATSFSVFFYRMIFSPLRRLLEAVEIIASGHPEVRVGLEGPEEIGRIAQAVDRLADLLARTQDALYRLEEENAGLRMAGGELRERESYYHKLFEHANDAVFIYDLEGRLLDVNEKACAMLGYSKKGLLSMRLFDLYADTTLTRSQRAYKIGQSASAVRYESRFRRKDGVLIDVEVSTGPVDLKKGVMQSIITNITERKRMERSLRESEEKFRTFMETASDLMFMTDANGLLVYVNEAMANRLGYLKEELIGRPLQDLYDRESLEVARQMRQRLLDGGEDLHVLVWETKTRKRIYGEMKVVGWFDETGKFLGIRGVFRDITERRKIERSQRLAEMGKLTAGIAHEIKNQLAALTMRTQIGLLRPSLSDELRQDLQIILDQCTHLDEIVKRLLKFSRPGEGRMTQVDLHRTLDQVLLLVEKQYSARNVRITRKYEAGHSQIRCDEKQMQEVFLNLLVNAFEAMPNGGEISVRTSNIDDLVAIDVQDTGIGIREEDLEHIFDPFFTTKEEGTGLGLSVCFGIVQAHRGDLLFESEPGKGTTARVLLPVVPV